MPSLTLEPQTRAHAAPMFALLSDPAIYQFENAPPQSLAWLTERLTKLETRESPDGSQLWLNWVIRLSDAQLARLPRPPDPAHAGLAGYVQATVHRNGIAEIAYELHSSYWRQRIGSTAVSQLLAMLRDDYRVTLATATLKAANFRSRGLLQHLGFVPHTDQLPGWSVEEDEILMLRRLG